MSQSQMSWWTIWKCQMRLPVRASRQTRLSEKRLLPGRCAAVEIAGRHLDRDVDVAEFFVGAQRRPGAGVAGVLPGVVFPGFVAEFAGMRDGAGRSRCACRCGRRSRGCSRARSSSMRARCPPARPRPRPPRRARRWPANWRRSDPACTTSRSRPFGQIRRCRSLPKPGIGTPGLRVERDELKTGRDQQDAVVALAVAPVGQAAILSADARSPRAPSSSRYIQSVSPVAASTATASRREPAVK